MSEPTYSDRGFAQMPPLTDRNGRTVRVYESSAADEPCVWLSIEDGNSSLCAHLDHTVAAELCEQIARLFILHHQASDPISDTYGDDWLQP